MAAHAPTFPAHSRHSNKSGNGWDINLYHFNQYENMNTPIIATHTPGPWITEVPPSSCLTTRFIVGPNREHVAKIGHMDYTSGSLWSDLANARLIAAAPDLLALLVSARSVILDPSDPEIHPNEFANMSEYQKECNRLFNIKARAVLASIK